MKKYKINFQKLNKHKRRGCFYPKLILEIALFEQVEWHNRLEVDYWRSNYISLVSKKNGQLIYAKDINPMDYLIDIFNEKLHSCIESL
jgi:hypothetical protein